MRSIGLAASLGLLCLQSQSVYANEEADIKDLSIGMAIDQGLSVVVELDNQYRFTLGNDGAAFDYIFKAGQFDSSMPVTWFVGVGGWAEWEKEAFGARLPLGLNWDIGQGWDVYGQIQPAIDLYSGAELQVDGALGIRYAF